MFIRIWIVIGPGTAVPVGTDEDAIAEFWTEAGHNVHGAEYGAVVTFQISLLPDDGETVGFELTHNPLTASVVSLRVHRAGSEFALGCAEGVGTIGGEHWVRCCLSPVCRLLARCAGGEEEEHHEECGMWNVECGMWNVE